MHPQRARIPWHSQNYLNPCRCSANMIFPQRVKSGNLGVQFHAAGNKDFHDRRFTALETLLSAFGGGEGFIKSTAITKKPLQKRWRLDQSISAFHTHHSKSPRRSTATETSWNLLQSQGEATLTVSKVERKSQLCGALKVYLLLLIALF